MLYKTYKQDDDYYIEELQSGRIIWDGLGEVEAKSMCRNLNLGGGFDGSTPDFFFNEF